MSLPVEIDFALIKLGDGATPTEVFTTICGLQDATLNETVNTNDRFVRNCQTPGAVPQRRVQATGRQTDITGTGFTNVSNIASVRGALGLVRNYRIEAYRRDGSDTGVLLGTYAGAFMMTSSNLSMTSDTPGSAEITLSSDGPVTYTPNP